jgi:hypothetical protein
MKRPYLNKIEREMYREYLEGNIKRCIIFDRYETAKACRDFKRAIINELKHVIEHIKKD